jgi:hypothetical protein
MGLDDMEVRKKGVQIRLQDDDIPPESPRRECTVTNHGLDCRATNPTIGGRFDDVKGAAKRKIGDWPSLICL